MLLDTLGDGLLGNQLAGKDTIRAVEGPIATSRGQYTITAGQSFCCRLILN